MKIEEFEKYLINLHPDLYSFSYILIPDDLQASQLIIDSIANFIIDKKSSLEKILSESIRNEILLTEIKHLICKSIYDIAKKRFHQIKSSVDLNGLDPFYQLDFDERAVIFLRHKFKINNELICFISSMGQDELIAVLTKARAKICIELKNEPDLQGLL